MRNRNDVDYQTEHHEAEQLDEKIHRFSGFLETENYYADNRADDYAVFDLQIEQHIQTESRARDVADVKSQPAERDERGEQITASRNRLICYVLRAPPADRQNAPDI